MGRYSQARRRGTGHPITSLLDVPVYAENWVFSGDGDSVVVQGICPWPAPVLHYQIADDAIFSQLEIDDALPDCATDAPIGIAAGDYYTHARWEDGDGNPLSNWSPAVPVTLSP